MRNEKALGELGGAFMNEFVGLCPNKYLYLKNDVKEIIFNQTQIQVLRLQNFRWSFLNRKDYQLFRGKKLQC